jgi:hypothetical protein
MASIDSVADDVFSLDGKVNSILDYLKNISEEDKTPDNFFSNLVEQKNNDEKKEENRLAQLKRKKRAYQAIPVAFDSLTQEGSKDLSKAIAGIMPSPVSLLPVEKAFKWLPLLLAGLTALGLALYLFRDKILNFLENLIPNFIKALTTEFLPGLVKGITGARVAAAAAGVVAPIVQSAQDYKAITTAAKDAKDTKNRKAITAAAEDAKRRKAIAEAALKEASLARQLATEAAFGVDASGKIITSRSKDLNAFIRTTLQSIDPAERVKLQAIIREWNTRTLTMSVEELQETLFKLYRSGLKADDLYTKSLTELLRLKELGLTAQEIQELSKIAKPTIYSFAVETRRTLFEQAVYNLRTIPKEMYQTVRGAVQEAYRSPFTSEEYANIIKPIEGFIDNIFTGIGDRISAAKVAFMESAPVKKALDISSKISTTFLKLDKWIFEPLFVFLGSLEVEQTIASEIEKNGYNFRTILDAWVGSVASVFTFGIVSLKDVKEKTDKKLKEIKNKDYAKVFLMELFSIPDLYNKFIYGLGENISKLFGQQELSKQFAELRKTADLTAWYNNIMSKVYNWIYSVVDFLTFGKGVQKPKPVLEKDFSTINTPSVDADLIDNKQYYDKALKAYVDVIEKSNKEVVKTIKEDKNTTTKLSESISALSQSIAENSKNINMINNSRNTTSITISPTTSKSYRDSRMA